MHFTYIAWTNGEHANSHAIHYQEYLNTNMASYTETTASILTSINKQHTLNNKDRYAHQYILFAVHYKYLVGNLFCEKLGNCYCTNL